MKIFICAAVAAAIVAPAASFAKTGHEFTVTAAPNVTEWSTRMGAMLDRNLSNAASSGLNGDLAASGMVVVRFKCSESGRPTAISLVQRASDFRLNEIARRSVANVPTMHPLPAAFAADQTFVAVITVARDQQELDDQITRYRLAQSTRKGEAEFAIFAGTGSRRSL